MIRFKEYLEERFINVIGDESVKNKYKDQVWDILQKSYASIGGIKGSGFESPESMVKNIPFWKIIAKDGVVHAVVLYKDKGGRKSVAVGSDGSDYAKKHIADVMKNDIFRSFGEKSKGSLGMLMKVVPWDILKNYTLTPTEVQRVLKENVISVSDLKQDEIPADGQLVLEKYPFLRDYAYLRTIGGSNVFKVMFGTPGKTIEALV